MLLLQGENVPDGFGDRILTQGLGLAHTISVISNRVGFAVQIKTEHVLGFVGRLDRLGDVRRLSTQS